jgi:hypothetical protein
LFQHPVGGELKLPLADELFVSTWLRYQQEAESSGIFAVLQKNFNQLKFPISEGISRTEEYRSAVNRGIPPNQTTRQDSLQLQHPEAVQLIIHQTAAGKIPLLYTGDRQDFINLVCALTKKNEPVPIPESMGAQIVSGYNNWGRIREYRERWQRANPEQDWDLEFQRLIPQKDLYQDTFVILSNNEYSGVPARDMELTKNTWRQMSLVVRREHECAHYLMRRLFGQMRNNMLDELIADYAGLVSAFGRYRAAYFLHFLGLTDYPRSWKGGRIENYRGTPALSEGAFEVLKRLVIKAAYNLESFAAIENFASSNHEECLEMIIALTYLTMEELASERCHVLLQQALNEFHL